MSEKSTERYTHITISCKDGTYRILKSQGLYSYATALELGKDLEGENFQHVSILIN